MPKFRTLNERLPNNTSPGSSGTIEAAPIRVINGVLQYWNQVTGQWVSVVDEANVTNVTNVTNVNNTTGPTTVNNYGGSTDVVRELYFAGLGHRLE